MNTKDFLIIAAVGFAMYAFLNNRKNSMGESLNTINYAWPHGNPATANPYFDMSIYTGLPYTGINFMDGK